MYCSAGYTFDNVLVVPQKFSPGAGQLRCCTIAGPLKLKSVSTVVVDCIVGSIEATKAGGRIDRCNVFGKTPFIDLARPGQGCFGGDPQFVNPKSFDYRLRPASPCRGRASDGGDVGCRFTPEMMEMLKLALQLRSQDIIKF